MPFLQAVDLACGYDRPILSGVNLTVEPGETIVLLGANGSGKSTLLKTLAGLIPPHAGSIRIEGEDLKSLKPRQVARRIASVPQDEAVPFAFTVRQIVTMGRLARSNGLVDTPEDHAAAEGALQRADCMMFADRATERTSGGERQRTLIARALAQAAPLLLMDEPSAHLDASHQAWLARLVRELAAEGRSVVVALHDLALASAVARRAILIHEGMISMDGRIEEVIASERLDTAFGTAFDRLTTPAGRPLAVPRVG